MKTFLAIHAVFWVLIPRLFRPVAHYDSTEALAWGLTWEWGNNKHPPLSGWLAEAANRLLGDPDTAIYLLGALCAVAGMWFVYRLASRFLPPDTAWLSALLLEGSIYYHVSALQFNCNVLSLALVPAAIYCFWRANHTQNNPRGSEPGSQGETINNMEPPPADGPLRFGLAAWSWWSLTGLAGGLALLAKYTNAFAGFALLAWLLATSKGRAAWRTPGPYLAAAICLSIVWPHIAWLAGHDWEPLRYAAGKTADAAPWSLRGFFLSPLRVALEQAGNMAASLIAWGWLYWRTPGEDRGPKRKPDAFLICAGLLPLAGMLATTAFLGLPVATKWAYAFVSYAPLLLFYCFPARIAEPRRRRAARLGYAMMLVFGLGVAAKTFFPAASTTVDARAMARELKNHWAETAPDAPLRYVGGDIHFVSRVSAYLPERPRPVWEMDLSQTVWESGDAIRRRGVLEMARTPEAYRAYREDWPDLPASPAVLFWPLRGTDSAWAAPGTNFKAAITDIGLKCAPALEPDTPAPPGFFAVYCGVISPRAP